MTYTWLLLLILVHGAAAQFTDLMVTAIQNIFDGLEVSSACNYSLSLYMQNLISSPKNDSWALKMFDATSKIPVGLLFSYNFAEIGDFTECLSTESADTSIQAKYCLAYFSLSGNISFNINMTTLQRQVLMRRHSRTFIWDLPDQSGNSNSNAAPTWAICLPSACTNDDITEIISRVIEPERIVCQTKEDIYPPLTSGAIVAIVILLAFAVMLIGSTAYDLYCNSTHSVPRSELLVAFSAYSNGKKLFRINRNSTELSCLNGLRVLSMVWVVAGHIFSIMTGVYPIFNIKDVVDWIDSLASMTFISATMSVDTFLVIGGTLIVYVFMKSRIDGVKFNIFYFYLHRYLRLTPPFAAAVLVSGTLLIYMGSGPSWGYVKLAFQNNCENYWWSALLYVQNFVNVNQMCIGQTWYLDIDMQLYILSPLYLFLLIKYPKAGYCLVAACIIGPIIASFYIAYDMELSALISNLYVKGTHDDYMNNYYLRTYTRASPWFIGVTLGYILAKLKLGEHKDQLKLSKAFVVAMWTLSLSVLLACAYGGHSTLRGPEYNRLGNAFHIGFTRPSWALALTWVIFACTMGYGGPINWVLSLPIFQVLNRFTYCIYILHVTILYMLSFAAKRGMYFSLFQAAYSFWGIYMMTLCLSVLWVLAFESPLIIIEKHLFRGGRKVADMTKRT